MTPPERRSQPHNAAGPAPTRSSPDATTYPDGIRHVAEAELYLLTIAVPCPACRVGVGLCGRCVTSARLVEHQVITQGRDQAVDELAVAA
jgi:hypothetical protein